MHISPLAIHIRNFLCIIFFFTLQKRGANIYAEFLGGSFTCDAYHVTEPRPDGKMLNA